MSLQNAAQHLAAQGRGGDSTLVHMSPREVRSLQDLAMAHGGSLTTNPNTGLPEAGFLESILPTVIGAGLAMIPGVGPLMAAGIVGGGTALATGDISKGITAGLGAYGGAGLAGGLMGAGAASTAAEMAGGLSGASAGELAAAQQGAMQAAQAAPFSAMGQGLSSLGTEAGRAGFMSGVGGLGGLARSGLAAAAPMMAGMGAGEAPKITPTAPMNRFEYQARPTTPTPRPDVPGYEDLGRDFGQQQRYFDSRYVDTGRKFVPGDFGATATPMPGMAAGGQLSLSGTIDVGKTDDSSNEFGQNSAAGYSAAGSGFPFTSSPSAPSDTPLAAPLVSPIETTESSPFQTEPMLPTSYMAGGGDVAQYSLGGSLFRRVQRAAAERAAAQNPDNYAPSYEQLSVGSDFGYQQAQPSASPLARSLASMPSDNAQFAYNMNPTGVAPAVNVPGYDAMSSGQDFGQQQRYFNPQFRELAPSPAAVSGTLDYYHSHGGGMAQGGVSHLGDYSDGGRMLRGPGDGVSDSIPATIGGKQPARLADGEFVVPARIVSELGNGSSEAGARKLYAMMDRIQSARKKSVGKGKVAVDSKTEKLLPA